MLGTQRDLTNRVNDSSRGVIRSFQSFMSGEGGFQHFKNDFNGNHNQITKEQMEKLDHKVQVLGEAVNELERSVQISNDPRYNRHF